MCTLSMSEAPGVQGLKLGMMPDEVLAFFPGSKEDSKLRAELAQPPKRLGTSSFVIRPGDYQSKAEHKDITQITFRLLDGRVSNFHVGYKGPQWSHVDQFVAKVVEGTNLPAPDQWQAQVGLDNQLKTLTCVDFSVTVFAGGEGGNLNYVQLQDLEADKKLNERRKKAQEQASPSPGQ